MRPVSSGSIGMVPARLKSERFPNKLLEKIDGIPILQRVIMNIVQANIMDYLVVTTDSLTIVDFCRDIGVDTIFMDEQVSCGSQRMLKVYETYPDYDHYVSFPADEPMLNPKALQDMWDKHINTPPAYDETIRTCWSKFHDKDRIELTRTCKIVTNGNKVIYFSRAPIPYSKNGLLPIEEYKKHVGIFIFKNEFFKYRNGNPWRGELSQLESLEQLAFIENKLSVNVLEIDHPFHGVDCPEDIKSIEEKMK